jgi:hypothetical protein
VLLAASGATFCVRADGLVWIPALVIVAPVIAVLSFVTVAVCVHILRKARFHDIRLSVRLAYSCLVFVSLFFPRFTLSK